MKKTLNPFSFIIVYFLALTSWVGYGQAFLKKTNGFSKPLKKFAFILLMNSIGYYSFAQPNIRTSGGLGQYGYIEKDAAATNFWVANDGHGNIYQYGVRTYLAGPNTNNYNYSGTNAGNCSRGDDTTSNFSTGISTGNILYSSVFVEYCGPSYSCGSMTPTGTCFNERSFFVMDVVPKTDALSSNVCYASTNSNVVLTFTISNNNTASQVLNRLWISNDGNATEGTDIYNNAFILYYEAATGSETFNGSESSAVLYGDYGGNTTSNNQYGHDSLGISIPQNTTGGLRCYVVLRGSSTYLNASAKTKSVRMSIMADGISITPNRDSSFSKLKIDSTQPSASYLTIFDTPATPGTISGTTAQCPSVTSQVYSVAAVSGASTYNWAVPTGWSITAGTGTNSITVTTGTSGQNGNITVTAQNSCGTSAAQTLAVTASALTPTVSIAITSGTNPSCSSSSVTFTATPTNTGGGTVTYNFKKGGVSVQSGASTTYTTTGLANSDAITCDISISGGSCLTATTATSNTINMTINDAHAISLSSGGGSNSPTVCLNSAITPITFAVSGGATGAGVTGLPSGLSGSYSGGVFTISGTPTPTATGTYNYTVTTTGNSCPAATATGTINFRALYSYSKVLDATRNVCTGVSPTITAEVYAAGITSGDSVQVANTSAEIGYTSTNSDPSSGSGWTWVAASFDSQSGNNDKFTASLGTSLAAGTYYYAYRFKISGNCNYQYADTNPDNSGLWGNMSNNGILTVANTAPTISSPTSASITATSATLGGNVTSIGCSNVTERGIYYSTTDGFADGTGTKVSSTGTFSAATFTQSVTGLTPGTLYYYKAFATNSGSTVYTTQGSFTTLNAVTGAKIGLKFNGAASATWRFTAAQDACDNGSFAWPATDLGTLPAGNSIIIAGANMVAMSGSTTPQLFYRVYKQGDTPPSFSSADLTTTSAACGSGNKYENAALNITLPVSAYAVPGTYNFEVYHQATNGGTINMGTSGSPYTATFKVTADNPTGATATCGTAATQIDLAWTKNAAGSNVMIVRSSDATFTDPTQGTSYAVSASLGGDTVIYNSNGTSFADTGLTAATQYYYKYYTSNNSCYSTGTTANATTRTSQPGTITGTVTQCAGATGQTYSIAAVTGATSYSWTVPTGWSITAGAGTTSITVTAGTAGQNGNVSVVANNTCGASTAQTLAVTVVATPATPGTISGTTGQCPSVTSQVYSVAAVSGASTYTWTVPTGWSITAGAGTNSITVTTGISGENGNITVTAGNSCGTSAAQTLAVTVANTGPSISSPTSASITDATATLGGNVTSIGCSSVTERGIYYSTTDGFADGTGTKVSLTGTFSAGTFTQSVTGLTPGTLYYYKAFATNSGGTVYTTQGSFTTTNLIYSGKAYFALNGVTYYAGCRVNSTCDPGGDGSSDLASNVVAVGSLAQGQDVKIGGNILQSGTALSSVTMYYRVYKSGNTPPAYSSIALDNIGAPSCSASDRKWEKDYPSTTLVAGKNSAGTVEGTGTYFTEIYYSGVSPGGITYTWYKTGTTPFKASFTVNEDIFSAKIAFKIGSASTTWYSANHNEGCDPGNNASFNNEIFGVVNRSAGISIGGNTIANTAITNAKLRYRVYSVLTADPSTIPYQTIDLTSSGTPSCSGGKTKKEQNTPQSISSTYYPTDGDYFIEVYFDATNTTGVVYHNNSGSNFKATISLYSPTPAGERDLYDGNYDPNTFYNEGSSGIYESYMGILVKDEADVAISGLNRVFDMDGSLKSNNGTNFVFGTQDPGLSFNVGTEVKIFTKGTHKDCGCSSWYYVYKSSVSDPVATDFPLPAAESLFENQINGKFTLLNSSVNLGTNVPFTTTTTIADDTTYTSAYNNLLTDTGVTRTKYKDYTDPTVGTVSTINTPVNPVGCPTCSGEYKVAIAMLAWVSTNGNCNDASSLIYHRDINKNKITDAAVVLNPNHPLVPSSNAGSPSKNTLPGTNLFYISKVTIGASGGTTNWNGTTWSNGAPTIKKNVTISSNYSTTTSGSFSCNDMTVADGITVTINNGTYIEALNTVTTTGTAKIIVQNSGNFVQRCDEKTPSARIEHTKNTRSMSFLDYIYWGSPVLENVISQIPSDFDWKFRWQSGTGGGWQDLTEIKPADGFITRIRTAGSSVPVKFTGTANNGILKTPVINYALSTDPQDSYDDYLDFALVANPYPCAIDAKTFLLNPNNDAIESTLYFWTSISPMVNGVFLPDDPYIYNYNPADYATWNLTGGVATAAKAATAAVGVLVPTGKIASGQGFFVEVKKDGDVYFDNNMRLTEDVNTQFFKKRPTSKELSPSTTGALPQLEEGRIWLNVSNKGNFRQLLLGYVNGATNNYDSRYDGITNTDSAISIYTMIGDKDLVIQGRQLPFDENEIVPLGYDTSVAGDFYINIDNVDGFFNTQNIYLKDNLLGTEYDLKQNAYLFSTEIGRFDNRFELKFTSKTLGINDPSLALETVLISTTKDQIKINSTTENIMSATVYDLTGKKIVTKNNLNNTKIILDKPTKQSGVYIVKVRLENNQEVSRKVVF